MSEESLAQVAWEAMHESVARRVPGHTWLSWVSWTDSEDAVIEVLRPVDMDAAAQAVAAHVASPTAGDFDHAAEVMRLRDACEAEIASLTHQRDRVSDTADQLRKQLRAVKAIADQHALGDSRENILAQAVLEQLDEDDA